MIGFIGLSHLGLVSSIVAAEKGFKILGFDQDSVLINNLNAKKLPIYEIGLDKLLEKNQANISFTNNFDRVAECDLIYISRDVPTNEQNQSDLKPIVDLLNIVKEKAKPNSTVVVLCQVSPGFTRQYLSTFHEKKLNLYYQVETLIFGSAVERAMYPERYIIGCQPEQELVPVFLNYLQSYKCPILKMRYESAELAKISINLFLIAQVTTTNTIASVCEKIGADWEEIRGALHLDKRIGQHAYLKPGLGIAGGNLERDLVSIENMLDQTGQNPAMLEAWIEHLVWRRNWVLRTLHEKVLSKNKDAKICIWGLAYKPGTLSIKNSPTVELIDDLKPYQLSSYDPKVTLDFAHVKQAKSAFEACQDSDVLIVMTSWDEFKQYSTEQIAKVMRGKYILDPFRILNLNHKSKEIEYYALGHS